MKTMKKTLFILTLILSLKSFGQVEAVTEKGDTIYVYDNGTWKNKLKIKKTDLIDINVKTTVKVDEFTNKKTVSSESWTSFGISSSKAKLSGSASFYNNGIYGVTLTLSADLGCMSQQRSTMKVKLSNDEIIEFVQASKTDCGSFIYANFIPITKADLKNKDYLKLMKDNVETLKEFDWVSIRIQGTEYYTDILPRKSKKMEKPEQFFRQHFTAIDNKL
mgnify:FL=1|jgi:hypothetical protein